MSDFRFAIQGANGRMGQCVQKIMTQGNLTLTRTFDAQDKIDLSDVDCIVDFSSVEASLNLLQLCAAEGLSRPRPLVHVIGTTGFEPADLERLSYYADQVVIIRSGNFSLGINILMGLTRQAAAILTPADWDIEVTEAHHRHKIDAPSGTALMLGEAAAFGRGQLLSTLKDNHCEGQSGPRKEGSIGFSVLRGGGIVGEHSAVFACEDEIITISHSARDRTIFARGAVKAALWGCLQNVGLYDMQDVLGF